MEVAVVDEGSLVGRVGPVAGGHAVGSDIGYVGERDRHGRQHSGPFDHVGAQRYPPLAVATLEAVEVAATGDPVGFVEVAGSE